jgi:hypothetical protein
MISVKSFHKYLKFLFRINIVLVFTLCSCQIFTLNVEKLELQSVDIKNETTRDQKIKIFFDIDCFSCGDKNEKIRDIAFSPYEAKKIEFTRNGSYGKISKIDVVTESYLSCTYDSKKKENTYSLKDLSLKKQEQLFIKDLGFTESMIGRTDSWCGYLLPEETTINEFFLFLKKQFEKRMSEKRIKNKIPKIPLIIHQTWFGITGDMPPLYRQWQKQWKKRHPGWRFICWSTDLVKQNFKNGIYNQETFDIAAKVRNYAKMSDVLRYELIEKFGGLYIDSDTENYEPMNDLHYLFDFYTANESDEFLLVCNCVFAAKPHHPVMRECIRLINFYKKNGLPEKLYAVPLINHLHGPGRFTLYETGPGIITHAVWNVFGVSNNIDIIFPNTYLVPREKNNVSTRCSHHFECHAKQKNNTWGDILLND